VGDVRNDPARVDAEPMAYRTIRQDAWPLATFLVRTEGDPVALVRAGRAGAGRGGPRPSR
jgi:hypothetical protein